MTSRLVAAVAGILVAVAVGVSPASAHIELVSAEPADGSRVSTMPRDLMLTFSDDVGVKFVTVTLTPAGGNPLRLKTGVSGRRVAAAVPRVMRPGSDSTRWAIAYRVVSADGHPVVGRATFTVAPQPNPDNREATQGERPRAQKEPAQEASVGSESQEAWPGSAILGAAAFVALLLLPLLFLLLLRPRRRGDRP